MEGQSDVEARREARRRRILLNSDDRLRKIKGYSEPDSQSKDAATEVINGGVIPHISTPPASETIEEEVLETTHLPAEPILQTSVTDDGLSLPSKISYQPTLFEKLRQTRVHIIILALVVRLLLFNDLGYLFGDMGLVPLLLVELTELIMPGTNKSAAGEVGLLGAAMMLSGLTQSKAHGVLHVICWLRNAGTDLAVYLFSFFLTHAILQLVC